MAGSERDAPSVAPEGMGEQIRDEFGPPHAHQVSHTLQLWILIPGIVALVVVGYLVYRLLNKQGERERLRAEKKAQRQMRKEKKKGK